MITRKQVVEKAREYLETPFQHQGRLKGRACDCVGIPLQVADELGIVDRNGVPMKSSDNANYSSQPLNRFIHEECQRRLIEKPVSEMQDGDVLTLRVPSRMENIKVTAPCHVAIVTTVMGVRGMLHAYAGNRKVVEHVMDAKWQRRIEGCFSFPNIED